MRSLLALIVLATAFAAEAAENQCVKCHEVERLPISLGHSFDDWRYSAHGRALVTCDKCHGGDPAATTAEAAHRGGMAASDPDSPVHPTRLAAMCGTCHPEEFQAYSKTAHARQIASTGRGATCMTCHGAMATSLPSPTELESRCAACHKDPLQARVSLAMLAATKIRLQRTHREIEGLGKVDAEWHRSLLERFQKLETTYRRIQLEWHTFDTPRLLQDSRDVLGIAKLMSEEAEKRAQMQKHERGAGGATGK